MPFFQVKRINNLLTEIGLGAKIDKRHRVVETRLTKMITVIVLVFVICNSFESLIFILSSQDLIQLDLVQAYLRPLADLLVVINSSVNVVIYCTFNLDFRNKFYEMYIKYTLQKLCTSRAVARQENIAMPQIQTIESIYSTVLLFFT